MKKETWVVVANRTNAKIYRVEDVKTLEEIKSFQHAAGRLPNRELVSDKAGMETMNPNFGQNSAMEKKIQPVDQEGILFAREIAQFLEEGVTKNKCGKLYLIAGPTFLGRLRDELGLATKHAVAGEINKELIDKRPDEIRNYLPPVL